LTFTFDVALWYDVTRALPLGRELAFTGRLHVGAGLSALDRVHQLGVVLFRLIAVTFRPLGQGFIQRITPTAAVSAIIINSWMTRVLAVRRAEAILIKA
jgi:hypothetical protein